MATGTGKTYTAFQIIWRLWKAGRKKRILYLADRNVLIDQTMVNDFRPFGAAMAKLSTASKTIERDDGTAGDASTLDFTAPASLSDVSEEVSVDRRAAGHWSDAERDARDKVATVAAGVRRRA
jgi:predicted helicase